MIRIFHKGNVSIWLGLGLGILYGVGARLVFTLRGFQEYFALMSLAFIFLVPVTLGVLTVYFGEKEQHRGWAYWIFMPWVSCVILLTAVILIGWEGSICVVMALPIFLLMSSLGGLIAGLNARSTSSEHNTYSALIFFAVLPFVFGLIERRFPPPDSVRLVETQIAINASPETVWQNIERVRRIESHEQKFSVFHQMGFPRPVEATLSHEGVG